MLTDSEKAIISAALGHYAHAAAYFNGALAKQALELRKKLCE